MANRMLGILLLVTGFIFVVPNIGWFDVESLPESFSIFWPLYVILWGVGSVIAGLLKKRGKLAFFPLLAVLLGTLLLLDGLGIAPFSAWLLPGILILFGVILLFGRRPKGSVSIIRNRQGEGYHGEFVQEVGGDIAEIRGKMGDLTVGGPHWELKDSVIEQKVGTIRLDLTETAIPLGETKLEVECKMGDVDIVLPEGLAVSVVARCRVGSMRLFEQSNNGGGMLHFQSPGYEEAERKVRLTAEVKIGDLDVKRA